MKWHYQLDGREFEKALGVGDGQGSLECCSPWGRKELDTTEQLNWTESCEANVKISHFAPGCPMVPTPFVDKFILHQLNYLDTFTRNCRPSTTRMLFWTLFRSESCMTKAEQVLPFLDYFRHLSAFTSTSWISSSEDTEI